MAHDECSKTKQIEVHMNMLVSQTHFSYFYQFIPMGKWAFQYKN